MDDVAIERRDRAIVREHEDELWRVARKQYRQRGRGAVLAVHADGFVQVIVYRSLDEASDSEVREAEERIGGVIDALRAYDPRQECVVLLADSVTSAYTCWRVRRAADALPEDGLVRIRAHG